MTDQQFPDPLNEAVSRAGERGVQVLSLTASAGQVMMRLSARRRERKAERQAQQERERNLERQRARLRWAPAFDRDWLGKAGIVEVARVWSAAVPYTNRNGEWFDPTAESAVRACEARLRTLHPHAMSRYDRLRHDGWEPVDAMREAAPLFDRPPIVHESGPAPMPRGTLPAARPGTIPERGATFDRPPHGPSKAEFLAVRRAHRIVDRLTTTAQEHGRRPLSRDELRTVLNAMTNLPPDLIDHAASAEPETRRAGDVGLERSMAQRTVAAERARSADLNAATDDPATRTDDERTDGLRDSTRHRNTANAYRAHAPGGTVAVADLGFPFTAQQVVDAAANAPRQEPGRAMTDANLHRVHSGRRSAR